MSDVGIFSINIHSLYLNYGAALHSFAFQTYLKKYEIDSVIVDYKSKHFGNIRLDSPIRTCIEQGFSIRRFLSALLNTVSSKRKYKAFHRFYNSNCTMANNNGRPFTYSDFNDCNQNISFDFPIAVCESDVIWSPKTSKGFDRVFFCDYPCFSNKIKVAYAPSISNTVLTSEQENEFVKLLKNFDFLSAREKQTAEYVEKLSGKECAHVLDPVLLLDAEDYEPYLEKQKAKNYLLVYNVMKNDSNMLSFARKLARQKKLKLVEVSDFVRNKLKHKTLTGRSIGEFLYLIKNASYFVTNSFHGVCFAILYKRDFLVFERDGIDLKVRSLVDTLGLSETFVSESKVNDFLSKQISIDWKNVYELLAVQRKKSEKFIENSILNNIKNLGGGTTV